MKYVIVITLVVYSFFNMYAQDLKIHFEHLTVEEGLSSNTVFPIFQDSRGFLWIGTYNGLDRYDGYEFIHYKNSEEDTTSISDNKIRALCEDKYGNIWVGTWGGGLNKFVRETEKFKHFRHNPGVPSSISSDGILSICKDELGNLWIGTEDGGLNYFDLEKETFFRYKHNPDDSNSISDNSIYAVYVDKQGTLWCGTGNNGINKFVKGEYRFITFKNIKDDQQSICGNKVMTITEDHLGTLWFGTSDAGLNKFNRMTNHSYCYSHDSRNPKSLSDVGVWTILEDSEGLFWVGNVNSGLSLFDQEKGTFTCYRSDPSDPRSLSDDRINTIYEDRSGVLWFGTWNSGLNKYDKSKKRFVTYSHNPYNNNSLSSSNVFGIYKEKSGILWVGTDGGGLNRIDEHAHLVSHFQNDPNNRTSISNDVVYSICEDLEGNLWVGTFGGGLNKLDKRTNKFERFQHDPQDPASIGGDDISQIFCDSYGDLWIGVYNKGLDRLKRDTEEFIHYTNDPLNSRSTSSKIYVFFEDKANNLWIGTYGNGLMMYNRTTNDFDYYNYDQANPLNSLSSDFISSICEDSNGILWIGTNGKGLNKFDRLKNKFEHYTEKNGLSNNVIYGILYDDNGNLWISTANGISKFNIKNKLFINYYSKDGLQGDDFNQWACFKSSDGKMYFGGVDGLNVLDLTKFSDITFHPVIVITDFQILHKPVAIGYDTLWKRTILEKSITETKLIELTHNDNIISFEVTPLDFRNPDKNQFAYMLEGFDKNWIRSVASRRIVTYTNLDPGDYNLMARGVNIDGELDDTITSLRIIIHHPWWATWWAYILYTLFLLFVFVGSTRFYLNRQRLKHQLELEHAHAKKLEEIDQMKSSFYANISHEFRTPLMLILGPVEKLLSKITDDDGRKQAGLIKGNANRLLNLINQLLDLSKLEAGKLKLQASAGNISQFVKGLVMEFDSVAERKDITLKMILDKENIETYFDKDKLEKIMTNVMSNAIKFTPEGGVVIVSLSVIKQSVEIVIKDTGIGIPRSKLPKIFDRFFQVDGSHTREYEGTGIGLALTKELVELHKGQIFVDSEEGKWTEVRIYFPLGRDHLTEDEIVEPADFETRKIKPEEVGVEVSSDVEDSLNEDLVDKTIVLVVEDNVDVREYISDALKEVYHVEEAANGEQGLRKAEKYIPDLIISDIMMPKMDGCDMTKRIRENEKTSHIPVILLTAKSDKDSKMVGLGLGADDYLIKPFDTGELLVRIKNLINTRRFLQEKFSRDTYLANKVEKPKLSVVDENFMNRIINVIEEHLSEEEFSIEEFGRDVGMSRSQIYRKIKGLTGKSPSIYLRSVRLSKAKQMIQKQEGNISEISFKVGFSSPAYFSRCFKDEFGYSPSEQ